MKTKNSPKKDKKIIDNHQWEKKIKKLHDEHQLQKKRLLATISNMQKRYQEEKQQQYKLRSKDLAKSILEVLDILEMALNFKNSNKETQKFLVGVKMGYDRFQKILNEFNIQKIESDINQKFDPHIHQALEIKNDHSKKNNIILKVLRCGYKLHDLILRPTQVTVNQIKKTNEFKKTEIKKVIKNKKGEEKNGK